jgi:hypothetical protein
MKKIDISNIELMGEEQNKAEVAFTSNFVLKGKKGHTKLKARLKKEGSHWLIYQIGGREEPISTKDH